MCSKVKDKFVSILTGELYLNKTLHPPEEDEVFYSKVRFYRFTIFTL